MKKLIICTVFVTILCFSKCYAETVTTKLDIYQNTVIKPSSKNMLGINDFWDNGLLYTKSKTSTSLSKDYKELIRSCDISLNQLRMAGADAHSFYWKDSLGNMSERANGNNLGLVEWIKLNRELNPNVDLTFTLNINDSIKNDVDLVRFLFLEPDDAAAKDEDGFNWAQYRVDLGIAEPVNIKTFEIGNEVYYNYVDYCMNGKTYVDSSLDGKGLEYARAGAQRYVTDCIEIIDAMRSIKPDISFSASSFSYGKADSDDAKAWNETLVNGLYDRVNYFVHHTYNFDYSFYWQTKQIEQRLLKYIRDLDIPEQDKPRVYVSEYGYWMDNQHSEKSDGHVSKGTSLYGTLSTAKLMNFMINMPYIEMANIHLTSQEISTDTYWSGGWDLFRLYDTGKVYATVPTEMLKIFNDCLGYGNVVKTQLHGSNKYWANYNWTGEKGYGFAENENTVPGILNVSAHTTSDGGLNLIFVNSSDTAEHNVTVNFEDNAVYKLYEKEVLTSDNLTDNNLPGSDNSVYTKRYLVNDTEAFTECSIPAKSIVLYKLVPISSERSSSDNIQFFDNYREDGEEIHTGKSFGLKLKLYENDCVSDFTNADVYVLSDKIDVKEFISNPELFINNIAYFDSREIKRNTAYFEIFMSDTVENGGYNCIIGRPKDGYYKTVHFNYESGDKSVSLFRANTDGEIVDAGNIKIEYSSNLKNTDAILKIYSSANKEIEDEVIVHLENCIIDGDGIISVTLPNDSPDGKYTAELIWNDGCENESVKTNFTVCQGNNKIHICSFPYNENDKRITFESFKDANLLKIDLKNKENENMYVDVIVALYDRQGNLISASIVKNNIVNSERNTFTLPISKINVNDDTDSIRLFLWESNSIEPLADTIYIK